MSRHLHAVGSNTAPPVATTVLITGAGGQLGRELLRQSWPSSVDVHGFDSATLDITDPGSVRELVENVDPSVIVNAAAYTGVDAAEDDEPRARAVNSDGVRHLATAANAVDAMLIHLSTDYVFDGTKPDWYDETDPICPLGVYGRTKAAGEVAARSSRRSVTLRTAWVYGALGSNFVATMLRLASERDELGVVGDQVGCPTAASDLAAAIVELITATHGGSMLPPSALYHLASPTSATWHEVAMATFDASSAGFGGVCRELTTAEYPTKARRPANSRLASHEIQRDLGITLPPWQESLPAVVSELETARG